MNRIKVVPSDLTSEYLNKFPTVVRTALEEDKKRQRFLANTYKEFEEIEVYRAIHRVNEVDDDDFWCDVLEAEKYNRGIHPPFSIEHYAISVNEDIEQLKMCVRFPNQRVAGIAKGIMRCKYGPADFKGKKTHHNWYLFDAEISHMKDRFQIVEIVEGESNE